MSQEQSSHIQSLPSAQINTIKPISKELSSQLFELLSHHKDENLYNKYKDKFINKNILVLKGCSELQQCLRQKLQMNLEQFENYMRIMGCRVRKIPKQQKREATILVYFRQPQKNERIEVHLPKIQVQESEKLRNIGSNAQISLQINLKKAQIQQRLFLEEQKQLKKDALEILAKNIKQSNLISQYTLYDILQNSIKDKNCGHDKREKMLDNIIQVRDRMEQCEGILRKCLEVIDDDLVHQQKDNQAIKND